MYITCINRSSVDYDGVDSLLILLIDLLMGVRQVSPIANY